MHGYEQALADEERAPRDALRLYRRPYALGRVRRPGLVFVATALGVLERSRLVFEPPFDLAASAPCELGAARCLTRPGRTASADAVLGRRFVDHDTIRPVPNELRALALITAEAIRLQRGAWRGGGSRRDAGAWYEELDELGAKAHLAWGPQLTRAFTDAVTRTKALVAVE